RGVGADAQPQCQAGHQGETGAPGQGTHREAEVLQETHASTMLRISCRALPGKARTRSTGRGSRRPTTGRSGRLASAMPPPAPVLGAHVRKSLEIAAAKPAFALGLRAATATIVPLVIGDATGQPIFGWMALGGWL